MVLNLQSFNYFMVSPKALFLVLFSSLFTLLLSALLYLILPLIIIYMQTILSYISFSSLDFTANILKLQDTISKVSTWMSSNMLSLNQSKTEFLLVGLPKQLSKISNPIIQMPSGVSLSAVSSARNLVVIFDSTLSMSDHISAISKSCFSHIRDLSYPIVALVVFIALLILLLLN